MRILERLDELAAIGDRIGYSPEEDAAHELAAGWFREAGLEVEVDAAGNLIGRVPGRGSREVWTGSHLDTVPGGGRFDGALGVVAGLEAVERLGLPGLAVVASATRSAAAPAAAACAARPDAPTSSCTSSRGRRSCARTRRSASSPGSSATSAAGSTFTGTPGHAGTTPMAGREDALVAAAEFVLRARDVARGIEGAVATVGQVTVEPGGTNVIPGRVVLSVDARAPDAERLDRLAAALEIEEPMRTEPAADVGGGPGRAARRRSRRSALPVLELPVGRRPRRGHPRGAPASPPGCSSSAA